MMGYNVLCNQNDMRLCWEKRGKEGVCLYVHEYVYVYVKELECEQKILNIFEEYSTSVGYMMLWNLGN